jgi:formate C-acetyltransferase
LLACFFIKCCEGDESQNLIVGGVDENGNLAENPLSMLVLEVATEIKVFQPSISVRISPKSSGEFLDKATGLALAGIGMPSFFNDDIVIKALEYQGLPQKRARDWAIVGCYEATTQGDTFGMTVGGGLSLPQALREFFDNPARCGAIADFNEFNASFKKFLSEYITKQKVEWQKNRDDLYYNVASPFQAICLDGCLSKGLLAEQSGARFNYFGVNILGIGTLVDSLCVIKKIVYDDKAYSLNELVCQVKNNFAEEAFRIKCRSIPGRYGTDSDFSNLLVAELSDYIADMLKGMELTNGQKFSPGFFWFGNDIMGEHPATPDGRRNGERVSYGAGPSEFSVGMTPTSILKSTACLAHAKAACGNPILLSFSRDDVNGANGRHRLQEIIVTYFSLGGSHVHVNITSADDLKAARKNPSDWPGLMVRISGFSAKFVNIHEKWQDALIAREEKGL